MTRTRDGEPIACVWARRDAPAQPGIWNDLVDELDRWSAETAVATFWWRDDDAIAPTPELDRLLAAAGSTPICLAVIPRLTSSALARRLRSSPTVSVLQHGYRHQSHVPGERNEYPASRSELEVELEFLDGRGRLHDLFGEQSIAAFVPPWHGLDDCFLHLLPKAGVTSLSRKGPRPVKFPAEGLLQVNAHVAPISWSVPPGFGEDADYLRAVIDCLRGRREGRYDVDEPTGLLTHHLAQNDRSYDFISRFVTTISDHPAAEWLTGREVFRTR